MSKTAQQIKNLEEALVWWQTVPEANVSDSLRAFSRFDDPATDCNTVACFGGWCARWPGLVAQGLRLNPNDGVPEFGAGGLGERGIPLGLLFWLSGLLCGRDKRAGQ